MDGVRQEKRFVSGRDIPNLVLKEKKYTPSGINRSNMTSEQVAKVLSSLGKRKVCFQHGDKVEIVKGINVTNDNVILISELPSGINS